MLATSICKQDEWDFVGREVFECINSAFDGLGGTEEDAIDTVGEGFSFVVGSRK